MESFSISATRHTPEVQFSPDTYELIFKGYSRPEDIELFYTSFWQWMNRNKSELTESGRILKVINDLEYFNSSSAKFLLKLFRFLIDLVGTSRLEVVWYYDKDDEDFLDAGREFADVLKISFQFISR